MVGFRLRACYFLGQVNCRLLLKRPFVPHPGFFQETCLENVKMLQGPCFLGSFVNCTDFCEGTAES